MSSFRWIQARISKGRLFMRYEHWRDLRIEAGCEDPGPPPELLDLRVSPQLCMRPRA